jgi:hypothetical protein
MLTPVFQSIDQKMRLTKGLEMSSAITVLFTAEKPRNLQHYMVRGKSLKSLLLSKFVYLASNFPSVARLQARKRTLSGGYTDVRTPSLSH